MFDYNPILPDIQKVIKKHFYLLQSSPEVKEIFPSKLIFPTYRGTKNLKENLLPSKFRITSSRHQREEDRGCSKCDKKCDLWKNYLILASKFQSSATGCLTYWEFIVRYTKFYAAYIYIYIYICFLIEAVYFHKEFSYSVCHVSVQRTFYDLLFSSIVALFCFDCVVIRYPFLASRTKSYFSLVSFMSWKYIRPFSH